MLNTNYKKFKQRLKSTEPKPGLLYADREAHITSEPAVLTSGQCIERCTAKDNTDVTDQHQQTVDPCWPA